MLAALNFGVKKLFDLAAVQAHHVVVVLAFVEFVHRLARLKIAAHQQAGLLKLHQHPVHRGQTNIAALFDQNTKHIFGRHVALHARLKDFQNLKARQGGFEAGTFEFVNIGHGAGAAG